MLVVGDDRILLPLFHRSGTVQQRPRNAAIPVAVRLDQDNGDLHIPSAPGFVWRF